MKLLVCNLTVLGGGQQSMVQIQHQDETIAGYYTFQALISARRQHAEPRRYKHVI